MIAHKTETDKARENREQRVLSPSKQYDVHDRTKKRKNHWKLEWDSWQT